MYDQKEVDELIKDVKEDWRLYYHGQIENCFGGHIYRIENTDSLQVLLAGSHQEHVAYPVSFDEIEKHPDVLREIQILRASGLFDKNAHIKTEYYLLKKTDNFSPDKEGFIKVYEPMPFSGIGVSIENDERMYFLIDGKSYFAIDKNEPSD